MEEAVLEVGFSSRPAAGRTLDPQSRPPALFSVEDEARRGARVWGDEADAWGVKSHPWPLSLHVSGAHGSGGPAAAHASLARRSVPGRGESALPSGSARTGEGGRHGTARRETWPAPGREGAPALEGHRGNGARRRQGGSTHRASAIARRCPARLYPTLPKRTLENG